YGGRGWSSSHYVSRACAKELTDNLHPGPRGGAEMMITEDPLGGRPVIDLLGPEAVRIERAQPLPAWSERAGPIWPPWLWPEWFDGLGTGRHKGRKGPRAQEGPAARPVGRRAHLRACGRCRAVVLAGLDH